MSVGKVQLTLSVPYMTSVFAQEPTSSMNRQFGGKIRVEDDVGWTLSTDVVEDNVGWKDPGRFDFHFFLSLLCARLYCSLFRAPLWRFRAPFLLLWLPLLISSITLGCCSVLVIHFRWTLRSVSTPYCFLFIGFDVLLNMCWVFMVLQVFLWLHLFFLNHLCVWPPLSHCYFTRGMFLSSLKWLSVLKWLSRMLVCIEMLFCMLFDHCWILEWLCVLKCFLCMVWYITNTFGLSPGMFDPRKFLYFIWVFLNIKMDVRLECLSV